MSAEAAAAFFGNFSLSLVSMGLSLFALPFLSRLWQHDCGYWPKANSTLPTLLHLINNQTSNMINSRLLSNISPLLIAMDLFLTRLDY